MANRIIVTGGNGFLGKHICRIAGGKGFEVISIARKGKPEGINEQDYSNVTWLAADVTDAASWAPYAKDCMAIIHSIGIYIEEPEKGITYERVILETTKVAGTIAKNAGINNFVYISAFGGGPDAPPGYMQNKNAAEAFLEGLRLPHLAILKPGMMYGEEKPETMQEVAAIFKLMADPEIGPQIHPGRPLPVATVAKVAVAAAADPQLSGKINVDGIEAIEKGL